MEKIQQQLQEYRQRKLQQKGESSSLISKLEEKPCKSSDQPPAPAPIQKNTKSEESSSPDIQPDCEVSDKSWTDLLTSFLVQLLVWLVLLLVAVKLEFGIVYCILTGFYIIWTNLSRRRRIAGEPSAYSVFNPNCERLPGTLTAEQLEAELLRRPM